jgi:hypothetical protein
MVHYRALFEDLLEVAPERREPDVLVDVREERLRREA